MLLFFYIKYMVKISNKDELTFNDVFILPWYSDCGSRNNCDVNPNFIPNVTLPILSANMNAVTGKRMCEVLSRYGWLGILPQDMSFEQQLAIVKHLQKRSWDSFIFDTLLTVEYETDEVFKALLLIDKKNHDMVVVNKNWKPIWYISKTQHDIDMKNRFKSIKDIPINSIDNCSFYVKNNDWKDTFVDKNGSELDYKDLYNYLVSSNYDNGFFFNEKEEFLGIINKEDIIRKDFYKNNNRKNLTLGIAIWMNQMFEQKIEEKIKELQDNGVSVFVLDTAHGHQKTMIQAISKLRGLVKEEIVIIAGNVCTAEATEDLIKAGANGVKVWIWPGAMCTTRMMTGVWRPQFTAIDECSKKAKELNWFVVADGGVKHVRDFAIALGAGASFVMLWTMFAGTKESVDDVKYDENGLMYKANYWMASSKAVIWRNNTNDAYSLAKKDLFNEGISSSKIYLRSWMDTVWRVCDKLISWLKSSMSYVGAYNLKEFQEKITFGIQSSSWYTEWTPHGKVIQ